MEGFFYCFLLIAFFSSSPQVIYPTDSRGRICGNGDLVDRPYLLFFDLTKCLNPAVLALGCQTPQVCVHKCPSEKYSGYAEANLGLPDAVVKERMRPYCEVISEHRWEAMSALQLIKEGYCPTWVLPSKPVIGRCLPTLVEDGGGGSSKGENSTMLGPEDTENGKEVKKGTIVAAVYKLGLFLELRGFGEKVFSDLGDSWWIIAVACALAAILSFTWIVLMRCLAGVMVWTSVALLFCFFGGLFGYTLYKYFEIKDLPSAQGNILTVNITPDYVNVCYFSFYSIWNCIKIQNIF